MCSASERTLAWALVLASAACGPTVPAGGVPKTASGEQSVAIEAVDAIPGDLDLVVRVDLTKVEESLGRSAARDLTERALAEAGSRGTLEKALADAAVVFLGLRVADLEAGDRVLIVQSRGDALVPAPGAWTARPGDPWTRYDARRITLRNGFVRIYRTGKRELLFVSPVEKSSIERVLGRGPDATRGQPAARGLLSLDYRPRHLSPELIQRFPALARLVGGIDRVSGIVDLHAGKLELEGRIRCRSSGAAQRVERFLDTVRAAGKRSHGALLEGLDVRREASTVSIQWPLPRDVVARWLHPPEEEK